MGRAKNFRLWRGVPRFSEGAAVSGGLFAEIKEPGIEWGPGQRADWDGGRTGIEGGLGWTGTEGGRGWRADRDRGRTGMDRDRGRTGMEGEPFLIKDRGRLISQVRAGMEGGG